MRRFFNGLPIFLLLCQVAFSAPTLIVSNTNIQYGLFKPAPLSTLETMESDLLVSALNPRTVAPGHSVFSGKIYLSYDFKKTDSTYVIVGDTTSSEQTPLLSDGRKISNVKNEFIFNFDFLYRLGLGKRIDIGVDFGSTPDLKSVLMKLDLKWFLSRSKIDHFQYSAHSFFAFKTQYGLHGGLGIPIEFGIAKTFRLRVMPQLILAPDYSSLEGGVQTQVFLVELFNPVLVRFEPLSYLNFFVEYSGKLNNTVLANYSAAIAIGTEFTFWKNFQVALATDIRLFELPIKIGGSLGLAIRL